MDKVKWNMLHREDDRKWKSFKRWTARSVHKEKAYKTQQGLCALCFNGYGVRELTVDHIIPLSKGGSGGLNNIQLLCKKCHITKTNVERDEGDRYRAVVPGARKAFE